MGQCEFAVEEMFLLKGNLHRISSLVGAPFPELAGNLMPAQSTAHKCSLTQVLIGE